MKTQLIIFSNDLIKIMSYVFFIAILIFLF